MNFPFYPAGIPSSLPKSTSPYFNGLFFTICRKFFSCSLKKIVQKSFISISPRCLYQWTEFPDERLYWSRSMCQLWSMLEYLPGTV